MGWQRDNVVAVETKSTKEDGASVSASRLKLQASSFKTQASRTDREFGHLPDYRLCKENKSEMY